MADKNHESFEAGERGNDATEDTTGKDILIPGDARKIKVQFYAALVINGQRVGGSLTRDTNRLLWKVQFQPYDNWRSVLLLRGSAPKPLDSDGKAVQDFSVHVKIPVRKMIMQPSRDPDSPQPTAMSLYVIKDMTANSKQRLGTYFPDINPEEENQWVLEFDATGYTAINLFSDETLSSPDAAMDLELLREVLQSSQLHNFNILISSFSGLSLPQDVSTLNDKAQYENEHGDPLRLFYPNHPTKFFLQIGDFPNPEERPKIDNRHAVAAFDDFAEYLTVMGFGAIYESEYVKKAAQDYYDRVFQLRAFELPGSNRRRYYAFIDFSSVPDLIRPKVGENIKVNLDPEVNASDEDWNATVVEPFPFIPAGNLTVELRRRRLDLPEGSTELNRPFCDTVLVAGTGKYRDWVQAFTAFKALSVTRVVLRVPYSTKTLRGEINSLRKLTDGTEPHHLFWKQYLVGQDVRAKTVVDVLNDIKPGAPKPRYTAAQAKAREGLRSTPNGIHLVQGPPGTGKTWYYTSILSELLHENDVQVVVVTPSNNAADDAARGISKLFSSIPSLKHKVIGRVHSLASERDAVLDGAGRPKPAGIEDVVDKDQLESECAGFAAAMYLKEIYEKSEEANKRGDKRRVLVDLSVACRSVQQMYENPAQYANLHELYTKFQKGAAMDREEIIQLRSLITQLSDDTLRKIDVSVLTLANAANEGFWKLKEDLVKIVIIDEGARATEMSTINAIANLRPKLLINVGDWKQMRPTVLSAGHMDHTINPVGNQASLTLLERLRRLGVPTYMLDEQMRMLERIARYPSFASYDGKLRTHASVTLNTRPCAKLFRQFIEGKYKLKTNRLIINVPDSQAIRDSGSNSLYNPGHIEVAMVLLHSMQSQGLFARGHLTLLTFYQDEYDLLNTIVYGTCLRDIIDVKKVDGFQGGEDDFIMLLFAGTTSPGFTSDPRRLNVALTRARDGLICIMNTRMIQEIRGHEAMFALINDAKRCHDLVEATSSNLTSYRNIRPAMPNDAPMISNPGPSFAVPMVGQDPYPDDNDGENEEVNVTNEEMNVADEDCTHLSGPDQNTGNHDNDSTWDSLSKQKVDTDSHWWIQDQPQKEESNVSKLSGGNEQGIHVQEEAGAEAERERLVELKKRTPPHLWTKEMVAAVSDGGLKRPRDQMS